MRNLLIFLLLLTLPVVAEERKETYTKAQFQTAAAQLRNAPLAPSAEQSCKIIATWTIESPLVTIEITNAVAELAQVKDQPSMSLITAYMAGQANGQLRAGEKGGHAVDGANEVLLVYQAIQRAQPGFKNAGAEKMLEAKKAGQLEAYLAPKPGATRQRIMTK
jgi:hypothetical protein